MLVIMCLNTYTKHIILVVIVYRKILTIKFVKFMVSVLRWQFLVYEQLLLNTRPFLKIRKSG